MNIIGLNAYHGDVSAVLVRDGQLVVAVEEERFRRIKHVAGFPSLAIDECLRVGGMTAAEVDIFAVSRDPRAHLLRKALYLLKRRPKGTLADRARNAVRIGALGRTIAERLGLDESQVQARTRFVEHHPSHLASAAFVSPFDTAAVCAIDGFGDFVSTSWGRVNGSTLHVDGRVYFPHSLGLLYLAVTQYLGFPKYGDEFKVMGLAPYGEPRYVDAVKTLVHLESDGSFALDLSYFSHWSNGVQMTWDDGEPTIGPVFTPKLERLLGPARRPDEPLDARHEAVAASLQAVFEEGVMHVLRHVQAVTGATRLCLAGGCAMNSVANGKIRERTGFREVFIQPAAGDNGTALGAAFHAWHAETGRPREFVMQHGYWGTSFPERDICAALDARGHDIAAQDCVRRSWTDEGDLDAWTAQQIADGRVVGWYQGAMEWGARALGNRSILADPRRADMREIINTRIKFRERFRPFAPSVLEEAVGDYFVGAVPDPFMLQVYPVRPEKRSVVPAITHVDGSGRLQTVSPQTNARYWSLIKAFESRHRRADAAEHLIQRERTHRPPAGAGAGLLSAHAHGRARHGPADTLAAAGTMIDLTRKRVVVTGGSGFLGRHVVAAFHARGCRSVLVPRKAEYDLTREADVERMFADTRPQIVVHLAAVVGGIGANREAPGRFFYDNVMMGAMVLEHGRRSGIEKFVGIGTICAYPKHAPVPFRRTGPLERLSGGDQRAVRHRQEDAARPGTGLPGAVRLQRGPSAPRQPVRPARQLRPGDALM